jgi:prepilin-type N-terminal cleavage/methylation domain-containing protein
MSRAAWKSIKSDFKGKNMPHEINNQKGFTLPEVLIAVALLSICMLALTEVVGVSIKQNAVAADLTSSAVFAQDKMEEMKNLYYSALIANGDAGSITTPQNGYYDDPNPFYRRLWQIDMDAPAANMTTISVRVISRRQLIGASKECTIVFARAK